jgi:hypothetical protein
MRKVGVIMKNLHDPEEFSRFPLRPSSLPHETFFPNARTVRRQRNDPRPLKLREEPKIIG